MSRPSVWAAEVAHAAPVFAALGDETRLSIVTRLCASGSGVTRQAVTKHLHALAAAGLVRDVRCGRERIWEIEPDQIVEARHYLDRISEQWDEALDHLRQFVEE